MSVLPAEVRAVSLWEPWASYMRLGLKTIETRSWATNHRGPLLICAARRKMGWKENGLLRDMLVAPGVHYGMAVCLVEVIDCVRVETIRDRLSQEELVEYALGDYSDGRWAWLTRNTQTFDPFPVKGKQGMFTVRQGIV